MKKELRPRNRSPRLEYQNLGTGIPTLGRTGTEITRKKKKKDKERRWTRVLEKLLEWRRSFGGTLVGKRKVRGTNMSGTVI